MRTKKCKNNDYVLTNSRIWVRNPTNSAFPIDINNLTSKNDYKLLIDNEIQIKHLNLMLLDDLKIKHKNIIIVSDGYKFQDQQHLLKDIKATVIGINGSLRKWNLEFGKMDYYLANNPYKECLSFLPKTRYFPTCIVASRTNPEFVKKYKGTLLKYIPTYENNFGGLSKSHIFKIDDYRNPLCAALNVARFFQAENILLFCCDGSFQDNKPGSEQLENGLYSYPQHRISNEIMDEIARFMIENDQYIKIGDFSSGLKYKNIQSVPKMIDFFD